MIPNIRVLGLTKFSNQVHGDLNKERKKPSTTNIQHILAWDTVHYKKKCQKVSQTKVCTHTI
jgi:hypothetical protein